MLTASTILFILSILVCCGARGGDAGKGQTVPLEFAAAGGGGLVGQAFTRLDPKGAGSIPFATPTGKLKLRFSGSKVVADADLDGEITSTDKGKASAGMGGTLSVSLKIGGRTVQYPFTVRHASRQFIVLGGAATLRGEFGGTKLTLYDRNLNGRFDEAGTDVFEAGEAGSGGGPFGAGSPFGKVLAVGGELYDAELSDGGAGLKLTRRSGPKAILRLKRPAQAAMVVFVLQLAPRESFYANVTAGKDTALVPGKYIILASQCTFAPSAQGGGQVMLYGTGGEITVKPGANELSPGPPFSLGFSARLSRATKQLKVADAWLTGGMGERYRAEISSQGEKSSLEAFLLKGSDCRRFAKLEYG